LDRGWELTSRTGEERGYPEKGDGELPLLRVTGKKRGCSIFSDGGRNRAMGCQESAKKKKEKEVFKKKEKGGPREFFLFLQGEKG